MIQTKRFGFFLAKSNLNSLSRKQARENDPVETKNAIVSKQQFQFDQVFC